jgi:hypothetical protein
MPSDFGLEIAGILAEAFAVKAILLLLAVFVCLSAAFGQLPRAAGRAPNVNAYVGYAYLNENEPSADRTSLNGLDSGITAGFLPHFGLQADVGYVRAANVNASRYHTDLLTFMAGPVLVARRHKESFYVHALMGGCRATGATPTGTGYLTGYVLRTAWAVGIGAHRRISPSFAVGVGFDLLHTSFFNAASTLEGEDKARATVSFVYQFGRGREK